MKVSTGPEITASETVHDLQRAPSVLKIKELLRRLAAHHGYEFFLCSPPPPPSGVVKEGSSLIDEWPPEWKRHYRESRLFVNDPVLVTLPYAHGPFRWTSLKPKSRSETAVMKDAAAIGMREGITIPIFGAAGALHGASFAGHAPRCDTIAQAELHMVSMYACARALQLTNPGGEPIIKLTQREREAMQWAAAGKSDWEIGELLGVSESAAHKRIESAKKKYGVATRVQAVVEALRHGHIQL
jgi:LuxR family quorum sensing-dependent transcriptional regulator